MEAIGKPLIIQERSTPRPGPKEILIQVKCAAVNPVDYYQRDFGRPPTPILPAVLGEDVAGIVAQVGSDVADAPPIGSRVLAFASSYYHDGSPDHGAFQEYVLARYEGVTPLPAGFSFEEGAILPLAALTAFSGYTTIGIPLSTRYSAQEKQAILIWGGSSSVGSLAVQTARNLGFTVYATAGARNLGYVKDLGAHAVFDYKSASVVPDIVTKAQQDGVVLKTAHVIVDGALQQTLDVLKETKHDQLAKVAHAPLIPDDAPTLSGVEVKFTYPPTDVDARNKHIYQCFNVELKNGLESGTIVPSPRIQFTKGGLNGMNDALDALKNGVSATKVVVTL